MHRGKDWDYALIVVLPNLERSRGNPHCGKMAELMPGLVGLAPQPRSMALSWRKMRWPSLSSLFDRLSTASAGRQTRNYLGNCRLSCVSSCRGKDFDTFSLRTPRKNIVVPPCGWCVLYCRIVEAIYSIEVQMSALTNLSTRTAHCLKLGSREIGSKAPSVTRLEFVSEK